MADHIWQQVPIDFTKHFHWVIRGHINVFECTRCGLSAPPSAFTHDQDQDEFFEDCDAVLVRTIHEL